MLINGYLDSVSFIQSVDHKLGYAYPVPIIFHYMYNTFCFGWSMVFHNLFCILTDRNLDTMQRYIKPPKFISNYY